MEARIIQNIETGPAVPLREHATCGNIDKSTTRKAAG